MKFINQLRVPAKWLLASSAITLAACSSSPEVVENEAANATDTTANQAVEEVVEPVISDAEKAEQEKQQQLAALKSSANKYLDNATPVDASVKQAINDAVASNNSADLKALAEQHPTLSGIQVHLGDIALTEDNDDAAKAHFSQAVAINPNNYFAYNRLGLLQRKLGEFEQAKASYQAAISSWQGFAPAHLNLAILNDLYLGNKADALASYETYELLTNGENKKVKGWIRDLGLQLKQIARQEAAKVAAEAENNQENGGE